VGIEAAPMELLDGAREGARILRRIEPGPVAGVLQHLDQVLVAVEQINGNEVMGAECDPLLKPAMTCPRAHRRRSRRGVSAPLLLRSGMWQHRPRYSRQRRMDEDDGCLPTRSRVISRMSTVVTLRPPRIAGQQLLAVNVWCSSGPHLRGCLCGACGFSMQTGGWTIRLGVPVDDGGRRPRTALERKTASALRRSSSVRRRRRSSG